MSAVKLVCDQGQGRAYVLLHEAGGFDHWVQPITSALTKSARVLHFEIDSVADDNWEELTQEFLDVLQVQRIRQASFLGFGAAATVLLALSQRELKLLRSLIMVDASTRPHPPLHVRIMDRIESRLPLGLPLRWACKGFDAKPFLQRVRCPVLIVSSAGSSSYMQTEAKRMGKSMPTAWTAQLSEHEPAQELSVLVREFQDIPAKCPQKNLR